MSDFDYEDFNNDDFSQGENDEIIVYIQQDNNTQQQENNNLRPLVMPVFNKTYQTFYNSLKYQMYYPIQILTKLYNKYFSTELTPKQFAQKKRNFYNVSQKERTIRRKSYNFILEINK